MGTVSDLVAEIQASGFDVTSTDALALLDRRHKQMCEEATWWRMTRNVSVSSPGSPYAVVVAPPDAVEIFSVRVSQSDGSYSSYKRDTMVDFAAVMTGTLTLSGPGGVFFEFEPSFDTDNPPITALALYPPPADASTAQIDGAFVPPTLNTAETTGGFVRIPTSFHSRLLAGVYSDLLSRPNEARPDLASAQEALFGSGVQELRDRADRRYRTKGPRQIRVSGVDA
jgi:hypothetical protein